MSLVFYWYPRCGTCRKAKQWLEAAGQTLTPVDLVESPPSAEELDLLVKESGLEIAKFFNTSGEVYRELGLKDKLPALSREEKLKLLASNGKLIKRPIVKGGGRVTVGFREDEYERVWGTR